MEIIKNAESEIKEQFIHLEEISYQNQLKVLQAFQSNRVREYHFYPSSGYGYDDAGRETLEDIYSMVFKAEDSLVRSQIASGTHAISSCLFGLLEPGDELCSASGQPYDTLNSIINSAPGNLISRGIKYKEIPLDEYGHVDLNTISAEIGTKTKMVMLQRSRGYSLRPALSIYDIQKVCNIVKKNSPDTIIFVDNCYGEFVEKKEPLEVGADLIAGSLIKNPGGGLSPAGGYICGNKELVERISWHLTAPGLGKELGASLMDKRWMYQGLFMAPHTVLQALKGTVLLSFILQQERYEVNPGWNDERSDIVQAICFNNADEVIKFCQIVQDNSPVDSDVKLEYAALPGYNDHVVMAAGTFVQGSSIELSCDAPLRAPYCAYLQGGLTYEHCRYLVHSLIERMVLK